MAGFLKKLFGGGNNAAKTDAERIYRTLMGAARNPAFYGADKALDNYDGRIDVLTLHLSVVLHALNDHAEQGKRLSQAIYEIMRDDFDVALREEGLSDTGVMKRIKPMIRLFYTRIKAYTDAFIAGERKAALEAALRSGLLVDQGADFAPALADYTLAFRDNLNGKSLGDIALASFDIPPLPTQAPSAA
ncbi:ubiquinol-cytochrome C chaperone family protein [Fretibacter rubidus]|uniref:ubiquinol-cytochrome C chaperone family protein n=1 Tax=Fretibacter rubidus TaxID=570162 RepID=UPI00352B848E